MVKCQLLVTWKCPIMEMSRGSSIPSAPTQLSCIQIINRKYRGNHHIDFSLSVQLQNEYRADVGIVNGLGLCEAVGCRGFVMPGANPF